MISEQLTQDQLIAMLAWQVEMGADEAVLDKPSCNLQGLSLLHDISGSSPAPSASTSFHSMPPQSVTKSAAQLDSPVLDPVQLQSPKLAHLHHIDNYQLLPVP